MRQPYVLIKIVKPCHFTVEELRYALEELGLDVVEIRDIPSGYIVAVLSSWEPPMRRLR